MKQALLVIDFIEGIAKKGSCAHFLNANPTVISNVNKLIHCFRKKHDPIFHIRLAFDSNYQGLPRNAPNGPVLRKNKKFLLDHSDTKFISEIDIQENDMVLNKKYGDPFYKSGLLELLKDHNIEEVIFTGVATDNAILFGAHSAITHDFSSTVITDAVGAPTKEAHEHALAIMKGRVVNQFLSTNSFLKSFSL